MDWTIPTKQIVVARYKEDITWIDKLPASLLPLVVQKGRDLPNKGREPTSFLWAILHMYDVIDPDDLWVFVQGNPFPHTTNFIDRMHMAHNVSGFQPIAGGPPVVVTWKATGKQEVFKEPFMTDAEGNPHHPGLPVGLWYEKWMKRPFPKKGVPFYPGGQFMCDGRTLRYRDKSFYRMLYDDVMTENNATPYVMERLWPSLLYMASV